MGANNSNVRVHEDRKLGAALYFPGKSLTIYNDHLYLYRFDHGVLYGKLILSKIALKDVPIEKTETYNYVVDLFPPQSIVSFYFHTNDRELYLRVDSKLFTLDPIPAILSESQPFPPCTSNYFEESNSIWDPNSLVPYSRKLGLVDIKSYVIASDQLDQVPFGDIKTVLCLSSRWLLDDLWKLIIGYCCGGVQIKLFGSSGRLLNFRVFPSGAYVFTYNSYLFAEERFDALNEIRIATVPPIEGKPIVCPNTGEPVLRTDVEVQRIVCSYDIDPHELELDVDRQRLYYIKTASKRTIISIQLSPLFFIPKPKLF